jgi:hypothetical protein
MPTPQKFYGRQITLFQKELKVIKQRFALTSFYRLATFLLAIAAPFLLYPIQRVAAYLVAVVALASFLLLVKYSNKLVNIKKFKTNLIEINQKELEATDHRFSSFESGSKYIDPDHHYTYDLDIFGKGSLFQFLNRTVTATGKYRLAQMLKHPLQNKHEIRKRQELINELSAMPLWRQEFSAHGMQDMRKNEEKELLQSEYMQPIPLRFEKGLNAIILLLITLSISSIAVWIIAGTSLLFQFAVLLQMALWIWQRKAIKQVAGRFSKQAELLTKYENMLRSIEQCPWKSSEGRYHMEELYRNGLPSTEIKKLRQLVSAFDNRNNLLFGIPLNLVFCWDVFYCIQFSTWHKRNEKNYRLWTDTIAFFDAVNSLANFRYNHPANAFPEVVEGNFMIKAKNMGHPLIAPNKRVVNPFEMQGNPSVIMVTGANMSGKSTYLRTVGVNMVLALAGAPVCASDMKFTPVSIFSNMRTTDSLFDDESYFFAELKRLKQILGVIEEGGTVLVILDEILKGTNSVDKLYGSQQFIRKLIQLGATVLVATHDLKLTEMESEFPGKIQNKCFEIAIQNDEMQFDYTLRDGVTHVMNATFLMKKMGIIDQ